MQLPTDTPVTVMPETVHTLGVLEKKETVLPELAVALTREDDAMTEASKALDQSNSQRSTNDEQGALQ